MGLRNRTQSWSFLGRESEGSMTQPGLLRGSALTQPNPPVGMPAPSSSSICWRFLTEPTLRPVLWKKKKRNRASKMILPLSPMCVLTGKKTSCWWSSAWCRRWGDFSRPICKESPLRQSWLYGVSAQQTDGCLWSNRGGTSRPEVRGLNADVPFHL